MFLFGALLKLEMLNTASCGSVRISSTHDDIRALHDQLERMQSLSAKQMQRYESKLRESTEQASREKILMWISPYDFDAKHQDKRAARLSGTCEWLIQSPILSSWRQSDSGVFILTGKRKYKAHEAKFTN